MPKPTFIFYQINENATIRFAPWCNEYVLIQVDGGQTRWETISQENAESMLSKQ